MKLLFKDMRSKLLIALALLATVMIPEVKATEPTDTIYNPPMFFTGMPKKYEIAGIRVSGLQNYEDYIVIGYSGLSVGDVVLIHESYTHLTLPTNFSVLFLEVAVAC